MSQYRLVTDESLCIACKACEAACKALHDSAPGIFPVRLLVDGPRLADATEEATPVRVKHGGTEPPSASPSGVVLHTRFRACPQCPSPRCAAACPTGALQRREQDGIVFVQPALCSGCGACVQACPHQLIWSDPRTGHAVKCDQCRERLDAGLQPACVTICPTQALRLVRKA